MKKKSTSQSAPARRSLGEGGFLNLRVLIGLFVMLAGVFLALVSFGPATTGFAQGTTREQMAVALAKALDVFQPPACVPGQEMFNDVPASNPFCPFIEELARRGITGGCAPNLFCPSASVTRQQMAVFLVRAQFPEVVPSGVTLRGEWSFDVEGTAAGDWGAPISYPVPMPAALTVEFRGTGSPPTAGCPGVDFTSPEAAPGFVCIYRKDSFGIDFSNGTAGGNTRFGVNVSFNSAAVGDNFGNGTWAATAP